MMVVIACSKLVFKAIKIEIKKVKKITKKAPGDVRRDLKTCQIVVPKVPPRFCEARETSAENERRAESEPKIVLTFKNFIFIDKSGRLAAINKIGTKITVNPKRS